MLTHHEVKRPVFRLLFDQFQVQHFVDLGANSVVLREQQIHDVLKEKALFSSYR